jgi:hypothetical protein
MSTLGLLFSQLYSYLGYANTARGFIENKLPDLLQQIGDNQYRIAGRNQADARVSSNPLREQHGALYALKSAYQSYRDSADAASVGTFVGDVVKHFTLQSGGRQINGYYKACEAAALTAMCYKELGDANLAKQYLGFAEECFELWAEEMVKASFAYGGLRGGIHPYTPSLSNGFRTEEQAEEFVEDVRTELLMVRKYF